MQIAGNAKILIVSEQKVLVPDPDGPEGTILNDATFESQKMNEEAGLKLLQRLAPEVCQCCLLAADYATAWVLAQSHPVSCSSAWGPHQVHAA